MSEDTTVWAQPVIFRTLHFYSGYTAGFSGHAAVSSGHTAVYSGHTAYNTQWFS
jgi:hypothetical protein